MHDGAGWQLSPAYDIVPSEARGAYHQLTLGNHPYLPGLKNTVSAGKSLGLGAAASRRVAERVRNALLSWTAILDEAGIAPTERLLRGLPFNL